MNFSVLVLASLVLALLLALALGPVLRRMPDSAGARLWALAFVPLSVGQALHLVETDTALPVVLRDPLVLTGFVLLLNGLRQYLALPRVWLWPGAIVLGCLVSNALFIAVWPLPAARDMVRLSGMAVLGASCLFTLGALRETELRPVRLFLQAVFGLLSLLSLVRLGLVAGAGEHAAIARTGELARMAQGLLLLGALFGLLLLLAARLHLMLGRLSRHDVLTGLLNRRGLDELAHTTLALARRLDRPVGLLLCDLDHFTALNHAHGAAAGDEVLRAFARLLQQHFEGAELIGRVAGDRFAVLLPGAGPDMALWTADALRARTAARTFMAAGKALPLSVSVGVLSTPALHATWGGMLERTEAALREAKARGGNACAPAAADEAPASGQEPPMTSEPVRA